MRLIFPIQWIWWINFEKSWHFVIKSALRPSTSRRWLQNPSAKKSRATPLGNKITRVSYHWLGQKPGFDVPIVELGMVKNVVLWRFFWRRQDSQRSNLGSKSLANICGKRFFCSIIAALARSIFLTAGQEYKAFVVLLCLSNPIRSMGTFKTSTRFKGIYMFQVSLVLWGIAPLIRVHARRFLRSSPPINLAVRDRGVSWKMWPKRDV